MNAEEIIKLNKEALYSSLTSSDIFGKFFNKSILHYAAIMEVFSFNKLGGISYEIHGKSGGAACQLRA